MSNTLPAAAAPLQHSLSRPRRWLYRLSAATVIPFLVLCILEGALRVCGYGYPTSFFVPTREMDGREWYVENRFFGRQFFPKGLARSPQPCRFPQTKADGTYRIFILGESAALGYPDPSVNFARILEVMLRVRYPGTRFEVVNTAMTAINSHVVRAIAQDCARHEPDLFIVYMGNNEVVGPFGTAGVLGPYAPSLALMRASVWAKSLRLGQFLGRQAQWAMGTSQGERWEGMAMFADSQVRADDPRMEGLYGNFAANLGDICGSGVRAGARVVVCTVGTNLKDSAPFASVAAPNVPASQAEAFQTLCKEGERQELAGAWTAAREHYRSAAAIDAGVADLHFRMGRCLLADGQMDEAREQFILARNLDALRFRADSRINEAIRALAGREAEGIHLVDAELAFGQASKGGIPGEDLFYEHVHMNFHGNYVLASSVFEQVARILPDWIARQGADTPVASEEACMERLAFGDAKKAKALEIIFRIMQDPPFRGQLDGAERNERMRRQLDTLRKRMAADGGKQALAVFRRALALNENDVELHRDFGEFLVRLGDFREALPHLKRVLREEPGAAAGYLKLAFALKSMGSFEQALGLCAEAAKLEPELSDPANLRGAVFMDMGKLPEAMAAFDEAARLNPLDEKAQFNLGLALATSGQLDSAIAAFREALRILPNYPVAHVKLAEAFARNGQPDEAISHFTEALRLDPNLIDAHVGLGITAFKQNRPAEALEHYRAALRINPKLPMVHYGVAGILSMQGKTGEAIGHLEEALRLQPNWPDAQQALNELKQKSN